MQLFRIRSNNLILAIRILIYFSFKFNLVLAYSIILYMNYIIVYNSVQQSYSFHKQLFYYLFILVLSLI